MTKKRNIVILSSAVIIVLIIICIVFVIFNNKSNNTASKGELNVEKSSNDDVYKDSINSKSDYSTSDKKQEISSSDTGSLDTGSSGTGSSGIGNSHTGSSDMNSSDANINETSLENHTTQEITNQIEAMSKTMYVVSSANVRNGASMDSVVIGRLNKGQAVDITGVISEWYIINYNNGEGFVHYTLLSDNKVEESINVTTTVPVISEPIENNKPQSPGNVSDVDEVIRLVNIEREKNGLSPLKKNNELCNAAAARAYEITVVFNHTRPDGSSFSTIVNDFNISYRAIGENIAAGQRTAAVAMNEWMNSQGHRENILSPYFGEIGVGCVRVKDNYGVYWVQIFKD